MAWDVDGRPERSTALHRRRRRILDNGSALLCRLLERTGRETLSGGLVQGSLIEPSR